MNTRAFGKYRIIAELGHGGMADVLLAIIGGPSGSGFAKLAVVKRLRPNLVEDPEFIAMLVDEARITARLNHPNVVQTMEVGVEDGEYYLAMEYLDGQPLHRIQRRAARTNTPIGSDLEFVVVMDTLAGLHHAHDLADYDGAPLSVVHRDVTPQNIFVTYDGQVKVVDFGIAKAEGRAAETKQGIVKGKVRYMSPEQAMGQEVDRRSDIFATGILLWEAATGKRFWHDQDDLNIIQSLIAGTYDPSPRSVDPSVPEEVDIMCRRALAREPESRYATAAEFRSELEAFLADRLVNARRQLGPLVAEMFAKERRELRSIIEQVSKTELQRPSVATFGSAASTTIPVPRLPHAQSQSMTPSTSPLVVSRSSARPALPPPDGDVTELSLLGFIPRKRRFGVGAIVGAGTMLMSFFIAAMALQATGLAAGGASTFADRSPSSITAERRSLAVRSVDSKWVNAEPSSQSQAMLAFAAPSRAVPVSTHAGPTLLATTAPTPVTPPIGPSRADLSGKHRRSLDTADPWAAPRTWSAE